MQPARAGDEEHRCERGAVDERGAEVGLDEDEADRKRGQHERRRRRAWIVHPLCAVGEEAGERKDEEQLAELRRLEAERADVEPAPRPAGHGAGGEDEQHRPDGADVDRAPQALEVGGLERERDGEADEPGRHERGLTDEEVMRAAVDVVVRDPVDRPEPVADQRRNGAREHPVEAAQERELVQARGAPRPRPRALGRGPA